MLKIVSPSLFFIMLLSIVTSSCNNSPATDESKSDTKPADAASEKIILKKDTLETTLTIPGELMAYQQVDLYAKVTGFVKELKVDIGSKVKMGQVLITLEAPEMMSQLSAAQSRLKSQEALFTASQANYNRLVETSKTPGTISQNDLEQAEAKKSADYANLEAARASFREVTDIKNYLVIRAPFDGTITARNVNVGAYVGPSGKGSELPALTLQQQAKLRLVISIPESYSGYFKQGDEVAFKVRSMPSENFKAKLTRLSGALDLRLRSQRAEADIENSDGKLLAGTVADVSTTLHSSSNSFIVPKSTVVNAAEGVYVIKIVNGKAAYVPVKKGLEANGMVEVFGALAENDTLLKKGSDEIKAGQEVR
ncbi:efflux RND transporter periplasmic adaptor subunit [Chryseolinea sp. H1M3-3]|uniref:efflux RND transporter periplasmic adaptor subunit n=1 Tax=Chryseolinea sp. H1M3-3 TaxID=3034144 RepID=UPI0023ED49A4|nr:efflux RND transporter periplasmic adaptor subunit [Chryseolinea sp. H1M3-3]